MIEKTERKVNFSPFVKPPPRMENIFKKKEGIIATITVILFLVAVFLTGYFMGKTESQIPIIIEKCSDTEEY